PGAPSAAEPVPPAGGSAAPSAATPEARRVEDPLNLPRDPAEPAAATSERSGNEPPGPGYVGAETAGASAAYGPPGPDPAWYPGSMPGSYDHASAPPADRRRRRQHWAGAILILIGLLVLGNNLGLLRWARAEYVVPMIL